MATAPPEQKIPSVEPESPAPTSGPRPTPTAERAEGDYLEELQRIQAEFMNYRKRILREREQWETRAKGDLLASLIPILDDLGRAREAMGDGSSGRDAEGLLLILGRLEESLRAAGLRHQETEAGTPFDPMVHEALTTEPSDDHPEGTILGTLQPGYLFGEILLRPARVRVSRGPDDPPRS